MTSLQRITIESTWLRSAVAFEGGQNVLSIRIKPIAASLPAPEDRSAVNVAFALDCSGSMSGEKLMLAKQAATTAVSRLRAKDWASLVAFDSDVHPLVPLVEASSGNKRALAGAIASIRAGSSTNLSGGWLTAAQNLAEAIAHDPNKGRVRRAILLTDGMANAGITSSRELATHAAQLRQRGISTTALGIGADFDETLLSGLAEAGGGNFQYIEHPDELPAFFKRELGEMLSVSAPGLSISIHLPDGARGELLNPFPVDRADGRFIVSLGDLAGDHELSLIVIVDLPSGPAGQSLSGYINARWFEPSLSAHQNLRRGFEPVRRTTRVEADAVRPDPDVLEREAVQRANLARRDAMRLDREGRRDEARAKMAQEVGFLQAAPASPRIQRMHEEAVDLMQSADSSELTEEVRKRSVSDAFRRSRRSES